MANHFNERKSSRDRYTNSNSHMSTRNHVFENQRMQCEQIFGHLFPNHRILAIDNWIRPVYLKSDQLPEFTEIFSEKHKELLFRYETSPPAGPSFAYVDNFSLANFRDSNLPRFKISRLPFELFDLLQNSPLVHTGEQPLKYIGVSVLARISFDGELVYFLYSDNGRIVSRIGGFRVNYEDDAARLARRIGSSVRGLNADPTQEPEPYAITLQKKGGLYRYLIHFVVDVKPFEDLENSHFFNGDNAHLVDSNPDLLAQYVAQVRSQYNINQDTLVSLFCAGCRMTGWANRFDKNTVSK